MPSRASSIKKEHITTLTTFESAVLDKLRVVVAQKAQQLAERAKTKVPGRLSSKITVKDIDNNYGIKGVIANKWYVARFFELGYGGKPHRVSGYTRRVSSRDVRGKVADAKGRMRTKLLAKGFANVKTHNRTLPRIHRPFLSAALEEMRLDIRSAMEQAVREATYVSKS